MSHRDVPWPATMGCNETASWQPQMNAWPCGKCGKRRDEHADTKEQVCAGFSMVTGHCENGDEYELRTSA